MKNSSLSVRKRKEIDTVPFDRYKVPPKQNLFLTPAIWACCKAMTLGFKLKIEKIGMDGLKPPFIVFGSHHAFMDFYVTPLALMPYRANYISELEGFEYFGEWIYRQIGCLGTRKFVNDIALVKNIKKVTDRGGILVVYPEARYANVGTNSEIPDSVGKLAKLLKVPVVGINMKGNYLQSPIWNLKKRKGVRLQTQLKQLFTKEAVENSTADEITKGIREFLVYDEYKYQLENKLKIDCDFRAEGLQLPLYKCVCCGEDFSTDSKGDKIFCKKCGAEFNMNEYGSLLQNGKEFKYSHIPDWYEWQRKCVHEEIDSGKYKLCCKVHIEALPNAKNFIDMGDGTLIHDENGFTLTSDEVKLHFPPSSMLSVHTEYNYRDRGQCITLSTLDNTYFLFPKEEGFNATKIQFATEYLYKQSKANVL